jgi:hypothetical protein
MQRRHQSLLQQVAAATAAVREKRGIWPERLLQERARTGMADAAESQLAYPPMAAAIDAAAIAVNVAGGRSP